MEEYVMKILRENWGENAAKTPLPKMAYLSAIVESSNDAIVGKTLEGIILSWNEAAERMFGYTAKEAIGKHMSLIIPDELQEEETAILKNLRKGKYINHYETIRKTKSGALIDVSLSISPIRNESGVIVGAAKIARQITDKKRLRGNLQFLAEASKVLSSSLDYKIILENVTKLAIPHIADWCTIDLFNKKGELELVSVAHKDPEKIAWARKLREKFPINLNLPVGLPNVLRTGTSELFPVISEDMLKASVRSEEEFTIAREVGLTSAMIVPLKVAGKVVGGISFITAESRKPYTEADLIMAEELANRVSLAMENAKLYGEAKKELEERKRIEKQKDDLVSMASHELKTPLTSITVLAQVLQKKFADQQNNDAKKFIDKMVVQLDKLSELVRELLDVTRMQQGKLTLRKQQFYVRELAEEVVESVQPLTTHKLIIDWNTRLPVLADKDRIRQVLVNLVTNAIKYSPKGSDVILSSHKRGDFIEVSVQDFGVGIAQSEQKKIFDRFYQAESHKTFPGLGLGLYISSDIIKIHGGNMWVKSTKGKGSTFFFTLPVYKGEIK